MRTFCRFRLYIHLFLLSSRSFVRDFLNSLQLLRSIYRISSLHSANSHLFMDSSIGTTFNADFEHSEGLNRREEYRLCWNPSSRSEIDDDSPEGRSEWSSLRGTLAECRNSGNFLAVEMEAGVGNDFAEIYQAIADVEHKVQELCTELVRLQASVEIFNPNR